MELLSRREELVLLSIWRLGNKAYGMKIREVVSEATGYKWLFGSIYTPLEKLLEKGLVTSTKGEPTPERGGRSKVYFSLTEGGKEALVALAKIQSAIWDDIPSLERERGSGR